MPEVYIPTTEQVRNNLAFGVAFATLANETGDKDMLAVLHDIDWPSPGLREGIKVTQFDVWLGGLLETVRRGVWADGWHAAKSGASLDENPYPYPPHANGRNVAQRPVSGAENGDSVVADTEGDDA